MRLFLDTETTGLLPEGRMASIAILSDTDTLFHAYVRPDGWTMPAEAQKVNGLSNDFLLENGRDIADVVADLKAIFADHDELWAHNPRFDISIIAGEFDRLGESNPFDSYRVECTGMLTRAQMGLADAYRDNGDPRIASLKNVLSHVLGITATDLHGALADAGYVREIVQVLELESSLTEG